MHKLRSYPPEDVDHRVYLGNQHPDLNGVLRFKEVLNDNGQSMSSNMYVIGDPRDGHPATIIDIGNNRLALHDIYDLFYQKGVRRIITSHHHFDHYLSLSELLDVYIDKHLNDWPIIQLMAHSSSMDYMTLGTLNGLKLGWHKIEQATEWPSNDQIGNFRDRLKQLEEDDGSNLGPDHLEIICLEDKNPIINLNDGRVLVPLHVAAHTSGSICFLMGDVGEGRFHTLFSQDLVSAFVPGLNLIIGEPDVEEAGISPVVGMSVFSKALKDLHDYCVIYGIKHLMPGHGTVIVNDHDRVVKSIQQTLAAVQLRQIETREA